MHATLAQQLRAHAPQGQLQADSRRVQAGDIFMAYPVATAPVTAAAELAAAHDGRAFIADAIARGASAVVFEAAGLAESLNTAAQHKLNHPTAKNFSLEHWPIHTASVKSFAVENLREHAGEIAAAFYGHPGAGLLSFAVTGTNGKTTCTFWLAQALAALNKKCALIGTLGAGFPGALHSTGYTTPDAVQLQQQLAQLREQGAQALAIEASSIGLDQARLKGLPIQVAVFTNLTRDHLDYHGSMAAYEAAKARLFAWPNLQGASINADDPAGQRLLHALAQLSAPQPKVVAWSLKQAPQATLCASNIRVLPRGMAFELHYQEAHQAQQQAALHLNVLGEYNVANWLACCGALLAAGFDFEAAVNVLREVQAVEGRLQLLGDNSSGKEALDRAPLVVVDYAHTPDALEQVLRALRPVAQVRGGKLVCVFGCGGNRDAGKRPQMAAVSAAGADLSVLTTDNPRDENPLHILEEIKTGLPSGANYWLEPERRAAIARVIEQAHNQDVIVLAGKGHERTQEIAGVLHPFYDPDVAQAALQLRALAKKVEATC